MANDNGELHGIGGWLAFFLVTFGLVTPVATFLSVVALVGDTQVAANFGPAWDQLVVLEWGIVGVTVAATWFAVWQFFTVHHWRTVRLAVGVLWLLAALALVVEPLGVSLLTGATFGDVFSGAATEFVRPLIYSSLWTAYLLKSERVANTYPPTDTDHEVVEVFE